MATKPKSMVGTMRCMCCGEQIPVKTAENGTINAACPWCDFPAWAKAGTRAHHIIMGKVKPSETAPAPKPAPVPAPAAKTAAAPPPAAPAERRRNSIFDLGA